MAVATWGDAVATWGSATVQWDGNGGTGPAPSTTVLHTLTFDQSTWTTYRATTTTSFDQQTHFTFRE